MPITKQRLRFPSEEDLYVYNEAQEIDDIFFPVFEEESSSSSSSSSPVPSNMEEEAVTPEVASTTMDSHNESVSSDEDSSNQEDEDISGSSQFEPDTENLPRSPIDDKVTVLVNFLLLKYQLKQPVMQEDMVNSVKECKEHFTEIFVKASECLEMVFGLDVKEVDPVSHSYVLLIKLHLTYDGMLVETQGMPKTGLLILILGVIFMKGNRATEQEVWKVLNMMDVHAGQKHFIFGEPRNFITKELVQENYLEYRQLPDSDPPCYEFLWGPRAQAEASKMRLLEFLARIRGVDPCYYESQYREALKEEEERMQTGASSASCDATNMAMEISSGTSSSCFHP